MKLKKPGSLIYWVDTHFYGSTQYLSEIGEKEKGYYKVRREVSLVGTKFKEVKFHVWQSEKDVHKSAVKDVPEWLFKEIIRNIWNKR